MTWKTIRPLPTAAEIELCEGDPIISCPPLCNPSGNVKYKLVRRREIWVSGRDPGHGLIASTTEVRDVSEGESHLFDNANPVNGILAHTLKLVFNQ